MKIVKWILPEFVIMENVPNITKDPLFYDTFLNFFKKINIFGHTK